MLATNTRYVPIELGNWVVIPEQHFHFHLGFCNFEFQDQLLRGALAAIASGH